MLCECGLEGAVLRDTQWLRWNISEDVAVLGLHEGHVTVLVVHAKTEAAKGINTILAYCQRMIEGNGCQRIGSQRAGHARTPSNKQPAQILNASHPFLSGDSPHYNDSLCHGSSAPLGEWTRFYKSDPRIAIGKYSPMEQTILHLGGIHTVAARQFLADKFSEERKMLRELQLQSPDYKKVTNDKNVPTYPCTLCEPPEKLWTAKVTVPAEEYKLPPREKVDIRRHVERMQLARTLGKRPLKPYEARFRSAESLCEPGLGPVGKDKAKEEGDNQSRDSSANASQEEGEEAERTKVQRIKMNVVFKSEEPKTCLLWNRHHLEPFLPVKKQERSITGQTNRNVFPIAEFPGDLLLLKQHLMSRAPHPRDAIRTYWLPEKNTCQGQTYSLTPDWY